MARPKNHPDNQNSGGQDATERVIAPEPAAQVSQYVPPAPRQMRIEREGNSGAPVSRRFPQVRGGICEFCGVLDKNVPSEYQYKLCPHYRGMQLGCSYCPENLNPDDVVYHETLNIAEHPDKPGTLIAWCGKFECSKKHLDRFKLATS